MLLKKYDEWKTSIHEPTYTHDKCSACDDLFEVGELIEHTTYGRVHKECFLDFARQKLQATRGVAE